MDKLSPLAGISAALKNSKLSESIDKLKSEKKKSASQSEVSDSLEQYVISNLAGLVSDTPKDIELMQAFVKGVLSWEFGCDVETDSSYRKLEEKIVNDIQSHPVLSKQVLKLIQDLKKNG